jgi:ERF superfamily
MTLKEKIREIYKRIEFVEKAGHNKAQNYDYVRACDVTNAVRKEFANLGVIAEVQMDFVGAPFIVAREKAPSAPFCAINVKCSITLRDVASDDHLFFSGLGTGCDTNDKASYKAQTGALKYALRNVGLIPDEDGDPEADESMDEEPSFQDARRGRPAPSHAKPEPQKAAPAASAKASTSQSTAPATEPKPATVEKAAIPSTASSPSTSAPVQQPFDTSDKTMPTEQEMNEYRARYKKLGDDLSEPAKGGLKTSRSNPINRKILAYMLTYVGAKNATEVTKDQWTKFLQHVDDTIAVENGYKRLAAAIDPEAFSK